MKFIHLIVALIAFYSPAFGQKIYLKNPILIDVKNQFIQVIDEGDSTVVTNLGTDSSKYIRIYNFNKKGRLSFKILDDRKNVRVEGQYSETDSLLTRITRARGLGNKGPVRKVTKYYKPSRKGIWKYYNEAGVLVKTEDYSSNSN